MDAAEALPPEDRPLLALLERLAADQYHFVTPTPATHRRVLAREGRRVGRNVRDVLGWSLPFVPSTIGPVEEILEAAGVLREAGELKSATVRVSSLGRRLFLHSVFPTDEPDSVFLGPDSYRFANLIRASLNGRQAKGAHVVDIGGGAGVGAIVMADLAAEARIAMTDINPAAIRFARINAAAAGAAIEMVEAADLALLDGSLDIITANPPYIADASHRAYRDGGDLHGARVSLDMAEMAVEKLAPGGRFILYTGSAIVDGADALQVALRTLCEGHGLTLDYHEIDPDVFGGMLGRPAYRDVERIALVAALVDRPRT